MKYEEPLMSLTEASHHLGVGEATVMKLRKSGQLTTVKVGRRVFITPESLDAYIARRGEEKRERLSSKMARRIMKGKA